MGKALLMRINKKLVPSFAYAKDRWGTKKEYVDVENLAGGLGLILLISGLATFIFWGFNQMTQLPSEDSRRYNHVCDMIAGKERHYISDSATDTSTECVVGPDWHRVRI